MNIQQKCTFDLDELRVLRAGFEAAVDALELTPADVQDLGELAVAVFGIIRGVDLSESERIDSIHCRRVTSSSAARKLRLWMSVVDKDQDGLAGSTSSRGLCSRPNRIILRTATLSARHSGSQSKVISALEMRGRP